MRSFRRSLNTSEGIAKKHRLRRGRIADRLQNVGSALAEVLDELTHIGVDDQAGDIRVGISIPRHHVRQALIDITGLLDILATELDSVSEPYQLEEV